MVKIIIKKYLQLLLGLFCVVLFFCASIYAAHLFAPKSFNPGKICSQLLPCESQTIQELRDFCSRQNICSAEDIEQNDQIYLSQIRHDLNMQFFWSVVAFIFWVAARSARGRQGIVYFPLYTLAAVFLLYGLHNFGENLIWESHASLSVFMREPRQIVLPLFIVFGLFTSSITAWRTAIKVKTT